MKVVAQIFLTIFFLLFFIVAFVAGTVKFKILNYSFWTTTFQKHSVYTTLANVVKSSVNTQVNRGGGDTQDIAILTDLITTENTKDFVDKNLSNLLRFTNGKEGNLRVYVPVNKVPNNILPKNISTLNQEMTLDELGSRFNIAGLDTLPLENISQIGIYGYYALMVSTALAGLTLIILALLVTPGKRFTSPGVALILSGILVFLITKYGLNLANYLNKNFSASTSINKTLAVAIFPPALTDISGSYIYIGIILVVCGTVFFAIKRPGGKVTPKHKTKSILLPDNE